MVGSFFAIDHISLSPTAGVGVAGQQRQQVAVRLNFDLIHLVGLDNLNVGHRVGQRFPQVCQRNGITHSQLVDVPEVIRTFPSTVTGDDLDRTLVCGVAVPFLACRTERR